MARSSGRGTGVRAKAADGRSAVPAAQYQPAKVLSAWTRSSAAPPSAWRREERTVAAVRWCAIHIPVAPSAIRWWCRWMSAAGVGWRCPRKPAPTLGAARAVGADDGRPQAAITLFESLGFKAEALLRDHVRDVDGKKHDIVVLGHNVAQVQAQMEAYGLPGAVQH
jgi:hypothetical protein